MTDTAATLLDIPAAEQRLSAPSVVLSFGMGLDSSALLLRWLEDPSCRDFGLDDLVVVTAHTGDEFDATRRSVERHILPRLREHSVRFVQCARIQRKTTASGAGVAVLDDSTAPRRLYFGGRYKLSAEMLSQGTIPQLGGQRLCSVHAKGNCLDPVIAKLTRGQRYRHAVGFEIGEQARAVKDALYNSAVRTGWYPLIEWGYDRQRCQDFVTRMLGESIEKSACGFCPFALSTAGGRRNLMERYRSEPHVGAHALFVEDVARRLNPRQTLVVGSSLAEVASGAGLTAVLEEFAHLQDATEFAVYEVRRVTPTAKRGGRGVTARSVRAVGRGTRSEMDARLLAMPGQRITGLDGIVRHHLDAAERCEHLFVVAPAVVEDKERPQFARYWQEATSDALF